MITAIVPQADRSKASRLGSVACPWVIPYWVPYVLAAFFALWTLRGVWRGNIVDTDAARHFMNGVFVHDLLLSGQAAHPVQFGKEYYGRLPALSMPYHPPLFPVVEALFFFPFGVSLFTARLVVSLSVAVCVILLYRLVCATHGSDMLALCVTVSTFSLWYSQLVATDVMLEFPCLAFTLAALYSVRDLEHGYPLVRALLFAVLSAAAVWTKQFAVFLGAVPPLYALALKRPRLLLGKAMWISSALFGAAVLALMALSIPFNKTGVNQVPTDPADLRWVFFANIQFYARAMIRDLAGMPLIFLVFAAVLFAWALYKGTWHDLKLRFYMVWIAAVVPIFLIVGARGNRYLFFLFPACMTIGYVLLYRGSAAVFGPARAWGVPVAFATAWFVAGLFLPAEFLYGPAEAAAVVTRNGPARVVYCGEADGNFIAAVRSRDPRLEAAVVPGEKLPAHIFQPLEFQKFCQRYAIGWVVLENSTVREAKWAGLGSRPEISMRLEESIPFRSSRKRWQGTIDVYRFLSPAPHPEGSLEMPVPGLENKIEIQP